MKKHYAVMLCGALLGTTGASLTALAQQAAPAAKVYRATPTKINDLVHTKLDVRFDYKKCYLYGKAWLTLKPHTYATDSLRLDAKGMDIKNVSIVKSGKNVALKYKYEDSVSLNISLDRTYKGEEAYTVYIDYTAKPNELKVQGSSAITDAKGLYFINPDGKDKNKPVQVWTQGETEASSVWFPTIDRPNQKTTQELIMTVPAKYVSLSNGKLVSQKANADGTRTDTWKMDQPHSPYLFMMAVGDFKIYKDKWRGKEVNYYLEPKYAPYAKEIFGMTPEAMEFYSKTLGVDYPWVKYAQIVVRDYVSGAMENTSATLHGSHIQATAHELVDAYYSGAESTIVHELFHQWFGDYVTAESWSNLTVNESFADFGETLWGEYKYGQDEGDAHSYDDMQNYLRGAGNAKKDLVRFYYDDKEDMFDAVTYKKGGTILNMLRNYLGREAFYKGLKIYLSTNAYKNGEAHQLRLALEEASGKDLNWFFNQWYFGAGHPVLDITYKWDAATKTQTVFLKQTQTGQIFSLPMAIDIYQGGKKVRHQYWMNSATDSVSYKLAGKPDLVNVDGDKKTTALKKDAKTIEEFAFQYANAPLYLDRYEAITAAVPLQKTDAAARKILIAALKDKYYGLRVRAIRALDLTNDDVRNAAQPLLINIAQTDKNYQVQAAALSMLGTLKASGNLNLFKQAVKSPAYSVQAAALNGIAALDKAEALNIAKTLDKDSGAGLAAAIVNLYIETGDEAYWPYIHAKYSEFGIQTQFQLLRKYAAMVGSIKNPAYAQQGINQLKQIGIQYKSSGVVPAVTGMLNTIKTQRTAMGDSASAQAVDAALAEINAK